MNGNTARMHHEMLAKARAKGFFCAPSQFHQRPGDIEQRAILCPTCGRHAWQEADAGTWVHADFSATQRCWDVFIDRNYDTPSRSAS